jgi:hypothetical protein
MFRGLAHFIQQHGDDPKVLVRFKDTLLGIHPKTVQAEAYRRRGGNSGSGGYKALYVIFVETYNKEHSPKLTSQLRTPLCKSPVRTSLTTVANLSVTLTDLFQHDVRGDGFLFRKHGAKTLAKRLRTFFGDRAVASVVGSKDAKVAYSYMRGSRQKLSSRCAVLCERLGVQYQDLLLRKRMAKSQRTGTSRRKGNGHGSKMPVGEVIFDATSPRTLLD